jgi:RNA polymerase sigma factor (sigma-70 family)
MPEPDNLLIAEFNARRSEEAFGALVRTHINLVFATALRQVGDRGVAEEVTQNVFIELARSAGKLGRHPTISGWLHRTTLNKARERLRSELRRQHREQVAVNLELAKAEGESVWAALVPMLDEALLELRERDRLAVILRFMEGQTFREIGSTLGVGEDAARKRVNGCLDQLIQVIFSGWGYNSPVDAANYIASLPAGAARNSAAERVVSAWAENDPGAAASWASSMPEGDARRLAFQNITLQWGKNDFNATAEWLKTLPDGDSLDTAMVTFANNCLKDYAPSTALEWAQTITGDGVRNNITRTIATEWLKDDPDAARAWLASSSLPEKIKNELLNGK